MDFTTISEKQAVQNISQLLFESEVQVHILHLQAIRKSLEIHIALGDLYISLGDLNDNLVEKSFINTGIFTGYKDIAIKNNIDPLPYIQSILTKIEANRKYITSGYIQQMVDNIIEAFAHAIYKLINLQ